MGARIDPTTITKSFDSNKIESLTEMMSWAIDEIGNNVKSVVIHRQDTDAWFGTITYDPIINDGED